ncbi:GC-rich sequence DNA-binding factor-like protein [Rhynchospora pubera]|uniref:GC-rich sequence DNA-binding factor-like protein n=1 Tax=Rhynchospora pubera TaxID=906938 RepID=A0AAV8HFS7_9POAL|nr:GC-rich sequence DNA-binding factor-like protein [Rhynchospora pubera]
MSSGARSKNFRRRSEDADSNTDDVNPSPKPQSASQKSKSKTEPVQTRTRLSFADDEEEDDNTLFRPSRSQRPGKQKPVSGGSSHKLTASRDRLKAKGLAYSSTTLPSNLLSQAGEYTPEKLIELQKNTRSISRPPRPSPLSGLEPKPPKPDKPPEPVIVLKGLVKPITPSVAANEEEEEEGEEEEQMELDKGDKVPVIPDQATIEKIRARRQQLQQPRHAAPDFISLDGGGVISSRQSAGTGGSSDEEEDSELNGRIALLGDEPGRAVNKGIIEATKDNNMSMNNVKFKNLELHEEEEDDEEERRWEEEQFRKGLGRRLDDSATPAAGGFMPNGAQSSVFASQIQPQQSSSSVSRSAEVMSLAQQAKVAVQAVHAMTNKLKESHKSTLNSLVQVETSITEALIEISSLEKSLEADGDKYVYFQQLREYFSVLSEFLGEKALLIEVLEEEMQKLHEGRALSISERREADLADESSSLEPAIKSAMKVLDGSRSLSSSSQLAAAISAAQAAATTAMEACRNLPVKLDEFGRDQNMQKRVTLQLRAEGRKRRLARQESKRIKINENNSIIEGELSTDESDSESAAYLSSRGEHLQTADKIFSDASNEYANLKDVKERFEGWKQRYPSVYRNAYVSDSVLAVFAPFVRLELVKWDPLYQFTDFLGMRWHKELFEYGLLESKDEDSEDSDMNLIPSLVEKVALPIFHHEIAHCWDVLSTKQTQNAVSSANMLISYLSPSTRALHELLAVVHTRLTEAVNSLDVPVWGPNVIKAVPGAGQLSAYRFGMSVRLLRNICLWKDILAGPALEKLAIRDLLRAKVLPHLRSSGLDLHDAVLRLERVVDSLSGFVSGAGVRAERTEKIQPLVEFVKELGVKLEKRRKSGVDENEVRGLARRLKNMMVALNDYDGARAILKMFQLKEAL